MTRGDFLEGQLANVSVNEETAESMRAFWTAIHNHEVELRMQITSSDSGGAHMEVIRDGWHIYLEFSGSQIKGSTERTEP